MAQTLVFAIGAVTRIQLFSDHFTARLRRRGFPPFTLIAKVRDIFSLALIAVAEQLDRGKAASE